MDKKQSHYILLNISRCKDNETKKVGQLKEYNIQKNVPERL